MRFRSTRGGPWVDLATALTDGLAPDGGLYMPESLPPFPTDFLAELGRDPSPARTGAAVLNHLLGGEGGLSSRVLERIAGEALDFPLPLVPLVPSGQGSDPGMRPIHVLELFHGPTLAFKDVGARVMARLLAEVAGEVEGGPPLTVLAATSGDTGGAVASAFLGVPGTRVVVLYPRGQVSPRQEAQFTTLGRNTHALEVEGTFDDCQRLVKEAFSDPALKGAHRLTSANSISVGRLIPQIVYHVHGRLQLPGEGRVLVSVPSGNFGNLAAGLMAKRMGLPVDRFIAATNANDVVPGYLASGVYRPRPSLRTISSAMDVGSPSNLERIRALYGDDLSALRGDVSGSAWSDEETGAAIVRCRQEYGYLIDPHGAVGLLALEAELALEPPGTRGVVLATAHPAKFAEVMEPLLGEELPLPPALADRLHGRRSVTRVEATLSAVVMALEQVP
jgi:threonine synthase